MYIHARILLFVEERAKVQRENASPFLLGKDALDSFNLEKMALLGVDENQNYSETKRFNKLFDFSGFLGA